MVAKFNLGYDYVDLFESGTIHIFDLARFFMGDVAAVMAFGVNKYHRTRRPYPVDNAVIHLEFASGSVRRLQRLLRPESQTVGARRNLCRQTWLAWRTSGKLFFTTAKQAPKILAPCIPNTLLFDEEFGGFLGQMENFLQVIRRLESPLVTGWDGILRWKFARPLTARCSQVKGSSCIVDAPPGSLRVYFSLFPDEKRQMRSGPSGSFI